MMFLSGLWHGLPMRDFCATHSPTLREVPPLRIIAKLHPEEWKESVHL